MVEVLEDPGVGIVDDEAVIVSGGEIEAVAGAGPLAVLGEWPETSRGSINDDWGRLERTLISRGLQRRVPSTPTCSPGVTGMVL